MATKILLTGASGMLGLYLREMLDSSSYNLIIGDRSNFDISDRNIVATTINDNKPDIIIHLAAETNVDLCEKQPKIALINNSLCVEEISKICSKLGIYFIFISTSNVFGVGDKMVYNELDRPCPANYYGKSKLLAEDFINSYNRNNSLIIRAGWMIGGGIKRDKKFVGNIVRQIASKECNEIISVKDKFGSITRAKLLAEFIFCCLSNRMFGTLNFASKGVVSRYEIAKLVCEKLEFRGAVKGVNSCFFPLPAPRLLSEGIETIYDIEERFNETFEESIKKYINEFV